MARLLPFVLSSLGAHLIVLVLLNQGLLVAQASEPRVFQVNAIVQPTPSTPHPAQDRSRPPEQSITPAADEPEPRPRLRPQRPRQQQPAPSPPQEIEETQDVQEVEAAPAPTPLTSPRVESVAPSGQGQPQVGQRGHGEQETAPSEGHSEGGGGQGGGSGRGQGSGGGAGSDSCQEVGTLLSRRLRTAAPYPSWALRMGIEGSIRLSLRIGRDGRPRGIRVVSTSGHDELDRHVLSAARQVTGLPQGCQRLIIVPFTYQQPR